MKTFKFVYRDRVWVLNLSQVLYVHISNTTAWIYMLGKEGSLEFSVDIGLRIVEEMEKLG